MVDTAQGFFNLKKLSREEILKNGILLGSGDQGSAYKLGECVYKFLHSSNDNFNNPKRISKVWNEFYKHSYCGALKEFATAEAITLSDKSVILKTPYISGKPASDSDARQCSKELKKLGRVMADCCGDNIKNVNGYTVPVDFDLVYSMNKNSCSISSRAIRNILDIREWAEEYSQCSFISSSVKRPF